MKQLIIIVLALSSHSVFGQDQMVIGSLGASYSSASVQLDLTVGEVIIATHSSTGNDLTQGFHQPELIVSGIEEQYPEKLIELYPNPTAGAINLNISDSESTSFAVYTSDGKLLFNGQLFEGVNQIDLSAYERGLYLISIIEDETQLKLSTYQVIKQ